MDISSDSKLIITSSADKNVKIWGLDFGDCHRSLFAHDDTVTQVQFEADSHYFWSVGKDKLVKYWDGDKVSSDLRGIATVDIRLTSGCSLNAYKSSRATMARYGPLQSATRVHS